MSSKEHPEHDSLIEQHHRFLKEASPREIHNFVNYLYGHSEETLLEEYDRLPEIDINKAIIVCNEGLNSENEEHQTRAAGNLGGILLESYDDGERLFRIALEKQSLRVRHIAVEEFEFVVSEGAIEDLFRDPGTLRVSALAAEVEIASAIVYEQLKAKSTES